MQRAAGWCKAAADASDSSFPSCTVIHKQCRFAALRRKEGVGDCAETGWYRVLLTKRPCAFRMGVFFFGGGKCLRIGILGGSFDPPHNGHHYMGLRFYEKLKLDKVLVIPAGQPPHKDKKIRIPDPARLKLCAMVFPEPFFVLSDMELRREGKSYTIDTLLQLRREYPNDDFFLLVGADMLLYFDRWYRWQEILENCTLCAMARDGEHDANELRRYADEVLKSDRVQIFRVPPLPISSTLIRQKIAAGENIDGYLPPEAAAYIKQEGFYCEK